MTGPCRALVAVSLSLIPSLAPAQEPGEPPCYLADPDRPHYVRPIVLRQSTEQVPQIYVAGGVPTILHLPARVTSRGTGIRGGGERRFKLLMGGDQILITPTRSLAKGERFPMLVALADGLVIPLSLTSAPQDQSTDGLVEISREPEKPEELRVQLASMTAKAQGFEASLRQALRQQESEDFALAGMLARDKARLTSFAEIRSRYVAAGNRVVDMKTFASTRDDGAAKVAVVFHVWNNGTAPVDLSIGQAFLKSSAEPVPAAIRAQPTAIPPNEDGLVAVVLDRSSFGRDDGETLLLQLIERGRGTIDLSADLALGDFTAARQQPEPVAPAKSSTWWPF